MIGDRKRREKENVFAMEENRSKERSEEVRGPAASAGTTGAAAGIRNSSAEIPKAAAEIPVLSFAGYSDSGKTTLLMRLIPELEKRGIRTAYLKHTHHPVAMPPQDRDSQRALAAGCRQSAVFSDDELLFAQKTGDGLDRALQMFEGVDLILVEGCKREPFPKVLVSASPDLEHFAVSPEQCEAVVCDDMPENLAAGRPVFCRNETERLADWIVRRLKKAGDGKYRTEINSGDGCG